jgi:hypothetical protein
MPRPSCGCLRVRSVGWRQPPPWPRGGRWRANGPSATPGRPLARLSGRAVPPPANPKGSHRRPPVSQRPRPRWRLATAGQPAPPASTRLQPVRRIQRHARYSGPPESAGVGAGGLRASRLAWSRHSSRSCRRSAMTARSSATRASVVRSAAAGGASRGAAVVSPSGCPAALGKGGKTRCSSAGSTCHKG